MLSVVDSVSLNVSDAIWCLQQIVHHHLIRVLSIVDSKLLFYLILSSIDSTLIKVNSIASMT